MSREKKEKDELAQVVKAAKRRRFKKKFMLGLATLAALFFAVLFLLPIVLTITNSFMTASEI